MTIGGSSDGDGSNAEAMWESLGRIKVPKSSDVLAERLKKEILSDAYQPGAALPTERELARRDRGDDRRADHPCADGYCSYTKDSRNF